MNSNAAKGRIEGKVALVTGAADGIGKAIAELFAKEGAKVAVADINEALGQETAKEVGGIFMKLDVSEEASWMAGIARVEKELGPLDILVNNAGILCKGVQDPENISLDDWKFVHKVNLDGVFLGCKYGIKAMKAKGGSIVNMSSRSGIVGVPGESAYASSKAAVRNHTKSVALYCAQSGYKIRCNSVHPASIMTSMWKKLLGEGAAFEENVKKHAKDIPLARFGTAEEVAYGVLYLASDESSYCTGSELVIDGGVLAGTTSSPGEIK